MEFICPNDGKKLLNNTHSLFCSHCDSKYKKEDNLISFIESKDSFYEGAYMNTVNFLPGKNHLLNSIFLWTINSGFLRQVEKYFKEDDVLLELGCAGGVSFFGSKYKMIGCDISFSSLKHTKTIYDFCIHANPLDFLPLPDASIEGVISSYFWEHLDKKQKKRCLKEINRVLKPKGKIIFLFDVETYNPFIRYFVKKSPELYKKYFLDIDGHIGYEDLNSNVVNLEECGYQINKIIGFQKTFFQDPSVYEKFSEWDNSFNIFNFLKLLNSPKLIKVYTFILRLTDFLFSFLPDKWSRMVLVIASKK